MSLAWILQSLINNPNIKNLVNTVPLENIDLKHIFEEYVSPLIKEQIEKNPSMLFTMAMENDEKFRKFVEMIIRDEISKQFSENKVVVMEAPK